MMLIYDICIKVNQQVSAEDRKYNGKTDNNNIDRDTLRLYQKAGGCNPWWLSILHILKAQYI
ncbi:hypothetical protein, partial [Saccharicrinis fermentans]